MIVQFVNQQTKVPIKSWKTFFESVLPPAMDMLPFKREISRQMTDAQVTIIFAGRNVMRRVNRETRGIDSLTDVLSFPLLDMTDGHLNKPLMDQDYDLSVSRRRKGIHERILPLGEIMISLDQAFEQAIEYGHSDEREVAFLAVHALLHLLGFDHQPEEREKSMFRRQHEILRQLGFERSRRARLLPEEKQHE